MCSAPTSIPSAAQPVSTPRAGPLCPIPLKCSPLASRAVHRLPEPSSSSHPSPTYPFATCPRPLPQVCMQPEIRLRHGMLWQVASSEDCLSANAAATSCAHVRPCGAYSGRLHQQGLSLLSAVCVAAVGSPPCTWQWVWQPPSVSCDCLMHPTPASAKPTDGSLRAYDSPKSSTRAHCASSWSSAAPTGSCAATPVDVGRAQMLTM